MNNIQTISDRLMITSREVAELTGKEHSNVMRDIRAMLEAMDSNLNPCAISTTYMGKDGRYYPQYQLDKDTCLTLLLGYDPSARMKVVRRLYQLEEAQSKSQLPNFADPVAAARAWADAKEGEQKALASLAEAAPKVEFVGRYVQADGSKGFREVAKLLQANEVEFREFLTAEKIMYRLGDGWAAYQNHADAGRFVVKTGVAPNNEKAYTTTKFTPKGINWIAGEWGKYKLTLGDKS